MNHKYYQVLKDASKRRANISIYGNIRSWRRPKEWGDDGTANVTAWDLKREIDALTDTDDIDVFINSYGGEVAEALAIYTCLQRHPANVHTYIDGIAASAATIVFMAGDTRAVGDVGLMMIHNCMSSIGYANSDQLRKAADDNDKWNQQSIDVYVAKTGLPEAKIKAMMDKETYLTVAEALKYGFATHRMKNEGDEVEQNAFEPIFSALMYAQECRKQTIRIPTNYASIVNDDHQEHDEDHDSDEKPVEETKNNRPWYWAERN